MTTQDFETYWSHVFPATHSSLRHDARSGEAIGLNKKTSLCDWPLSSEADRKNGFSEAHHHKRCRVKFFVIRYIEVQHTQSRMPPPTHYFLPTRRQPIIHADYHSCFQMEERLARERDVARDRETKIRERVVELEAEVGRNHRRTHIMSSAASTTTNSTRSSRQDAHPPTQDVSCRASVKFFYSSRDPSPDFALETGATDDDVLDKVSHRGAESSKSVLTLHIINSLFQGILLPATKQFTIFPACLMYGDRHTATLLGFSARIYLLVNEWCR